MRRNLSAVEARDSAALRWSLKAVREELYSSHKPTKLDPKKKLLEKPDQFLSRTYDASRSASNSTHRHAIAADASEVAPAGEPWKPQRRPADQLRGSPAALAGKATAQRRNRSRAIVPRRSERRPAASDDAQAPPPHDSMGSDDHQPRAYWECAETQRRRFTSTRSPGRGQSHRARE